MRRRRAKVRIDELAVYAIYDEWFEENGAVVGFTSEFINHTCFKMPPDSQHGDSAGQEMRGFP
jgi:hypothetical protein